MNGRLATALAAMLLLGGVAAAWQGGDGWIMLFNGRDMTGWTKLNQGDWTVADGILKYTGGGNGWLRSDDQFADFHLIAEWRYPANPRNAYDSGLFIRAGAGGNPWPRQGFQVNMGPGDNFGSANGIRGSRARADLVHKPGGDWNTYELILVGDHAICLFNGQKAWDATGVGRREGGHIGWQAENTPMDVKSVRIRRLGGVR